MPKRAAPPGRDLWLGIGLWAVLLVAYTWALWAAFTSRVPGGNDFLSHYALWQGYLEQGYSPYSDEAVLTVQRAIYGRPARPDEDQNILVYPVYSVLLYGPFVVLDYPLAHAAFMVFLQVSAVVGTVLILRLVHWRPPAWLAVVVIAWVVLNYHEARAILIGQFAVFGYAVLAGTLALLRARRDLAAGLLFVLLSIKPTLVYLLAPFLLLWAARRGRWPFVFAFLGGTAGLTLAGLAVWPTWIADWLGRVRAYSGYTAGQGLVWQLTHLAVPQLGWAGEMLIAAALVAGMLWAWWRVLRPPAGRGDLEFYWALGLTLVNSQFVISRSATPNYALLLVPTLWVFAALDRRGPAQRWLALAVMLAALVGHWWLHYATVVGNAEQPVMFVPWPVALGLALLFGRNWLLRDAALAGVRP